MPKPNDLDRDIVKLQEQLDAKKFQLASIQNSCQHDWDDVENDHIYREGYTIEGDPPGTMGVDHRGPCYVPPSTTLQWKRTCKKCNKTQKTQRTSKKSVSAIIPSMGNRAVTTEVDVPDFGGHW